MNVLIIEGGKRNEKTDKLITSSQAPFDDQFKGKLQYVIDSVQGYADCFWGEMTFEGTIGGWDVDHYPEMTKHPAYEEAEKIGMEL